MPFRAAVIIPHYNDVARLDRCLSALMQATPEDLEGVELVVSDNGSTQDLEPVRTKFPGVRFVTETERGAAAARNRGVVETTAERLYFLDSDCLPASDWLKAAHEVAPRADLVGGRVPVFDETPGPRSGAEAFETVFAFDFRSYIEKKGFSGSGNLVTHRKVFDKIGGFRPGLSEDLDWCHRATAAGFSLAYAPELVASHPTRADWPALERKWRRLCDESWGLKGRGVGARAAWALKALAMPASALVHAPRVLRHPGLADAAERRRALATLARLRLQRAAWMLGQATRR